MMIDAKTLFAAVVGIVGLTATEAQAQTKLETGGRGTDVETLQRQLVSLGYNVKVDGKFGPSTEIAVREFQRKSLLTVDGVVGASTWRALKGGTTAPATVAPAVTADRKLVKQSPRMFGNDVKEAQELLRKAGLSVDTDGVYGTGTEAAVRTFQRRRGLRDDGRIGAETWKALRQG